MNIVLYGEEKLLLAQRLEDLKKKYQCTSDDMNYMVYHTGETPMKDIIEDALTQPFLTEYKMVVLKNPIFLTKEKPKKKLVTDEDIKLFLDYIVNDNPTTLFVIYHDQRNFDERKKVVKSLRKNAKWYEMEKLTFNQLYKATREAIVHRNASIEDNALALFPFRHPASPVRVQVDVGDCLLGGVRLSVPLCLSDCGGDLLLLAAGQFPLRLSSGAFSRCAAFGWFL